MTENITEITTKSEIISFIKDKEIERYLSQIQNSDFPSRENTTYEDYFYDEILNNFSSDYDIETQVPWLVKDIKKNEYRLIYWDFKLAHKESKKEIFIELDDGHHHKKGEDDTLQEDGDELKNESIKRTGYYLIRIKAANYMYGFNSLKSLNESDSTSEDDADTQKYNVDFIAPYGKQLLIDNLTTCLQTALEHKDEENRGGYICCPDGYSPSGEDDDNFSKSNHITTYRTDIFSLAPQFSFELKYLFNKNN